MSIAASAVLTSPTVPGFRPRNKPRLAAPLRQESAAHVPARKWPFPPMPQPAPSLGDVRKVAPSQFVSRREMLCDVLLVAAWGALIPGLMWLGAAAGF
jgi:hypothetical protein